MKKIISLTAVLLLVAGCANQGNYSTKIENGSQIAVTGSNVNISNQDIYEYLMDGYGAEYIINETLQAIAANYDLNEEDFQNELDASINTYKTFMGDDLDKFAKENLGYDTFDSYVEEVMKPSIRQKMMVKDYADSNFETLAKQYHFKKMRMIVVGDEKTGLDLIQKISAGDISFEDAVKEYSTDTKTKDKNGDLGIVSDLSSTNNVDAAILSILPQFDIKAVYSVPVKVTNGYAVLEILETDINVMQEDILKVLRSSDVIASEANAFYLAENNFKVYEDRLAQNIKALNPDYIQ